MIRCLWMLGTTTALVLAAAVSGADGDTGKAKGGKDGEALFKKIDANGDGKISKEEFRKFFGEIAAKVGKLKDNADMADQIADKLFDKLDANGDGFLSREEFQKFLDMRGGLGGGKGLEKLKGLKDKLKNGNLDPDMLKEILEKLKADGTIDPEKLKEQLKKLKDKQ